MKNFTTIIIAFLFTFTNAMAVNTHMHNGKVKKISFNKQESFSFDNKSAGMVSSTYIPLYDSILQFAWNTGTNKYSNIAYARINNFTYDSHNNMLSEYSQIKMGGVYVNSRK